MDDSEPLRPASHHVPPVAAPRRAAPVPIRLLPRRRFLVRDSLLRALALGCPHTEFPGHDLRPGLFRINLRELRPEE